MAKGQVTDEELAGGLKSLSALGSLGKARRDSPFRDSRAEEKTIEVAQGVEAPKMAPPLPLKVEAEAKPRIKPVKDAVVARPGELAERPVRSAKQKSKRKADIYTERVTLQMRPEMRDQVDELARELQRRKTDKSERITANTVMRVAIRLLLEEFEAERAGEVNSEEQLVAAVRSGLLER